MSVFNSFNVGGRSMPFTNSVLNMSLSYLFIVFDRKPSELVQDGPLAWVWLLARQFTGMTRNKNRL